MQWLHSCSLDDEIDIGNHNVRIAGQRHADRQGSAIPMSRVAEVSLQHCALQEDDAWNCRGIQSYMQVPSSDFDVDRDAATRTPELCSCAIGSEVTYSARAATAAPLFSLFRPKMQRKVLFCLSAHISGNVTGRGCRGTQGLTLYA